jgi:ATP-dependent DNA helicase RecG
MKPINRLKYGEEVTIIGVVKSINVRSTRSGKIKITEAIINDGTSSIRSTWFNQPWIANRMKKGANIVLSGKTDQYLGRLVMNNPEWEPIDQKNLHTNRIVPVYPLTAKITQRWLRYRMNQVVSYWAPRVQDPLPDDLIKDADLLDLPSALLQIHFPDSWEDLKAARHRLAFDEIFLLQLGVLQQKQTWQERTARVFELPEESWLRQLIDKLPFNLTLAQQRALGDIRRDLASGHPMNRLIQGDVGSGKTIIAALGMTIITSFGSQAALMAPTSILAEQHYRSLLDLLARQIGIIKPDQIRLMIGATTDTDKSEIKKGLVSGEIKILVGTHALIEDPVEFSDLQLAVIDEQHRFGVKQRAALRSKGDNPHLLVMTATPIPRSLALTVYGDLDLSVINEMPPGRHPVETYLLYPRERERAYALIDGQIEKGYQAFIIYPLVEESDKSEAKAAVEEYSRLKEEVFPDINVSLLHGRMTSSEKEDVMAGFRDGVYNLLVSTSVVEVGVDVPNATVMIIEGANRFGLAQLHQFRGRVGRGQAKSYCILIPQTEQSAENERLKAMVDTNDGFILAERDLEQRGPGDFLGTRQAGFSELRFANLTDLQLIEKARHHAKIVFNQDPNLEEPKHRMLASALDNFWLDGSGDIS